MAPMTSSRHQGVRKCGDFPDVDSSLNVLTIMAVRLGMYTNLSPPP